MCFSDHLYSLLQIFSYINFNLSIHAPAKGATGASRCKSPSKRDFNPRSREGSDMWEIMLSRMRKYISIHAPAKGATSYAYSSIRGLINFNPRSREGSEYIKWYTNTVMMISIHAPAKGATPSEWDASISQLISIHAPAKGATKPRGACLFPKRFQSTLPRRERPVEGRRRESAG